MQSTLMSWLIEFGVDPRALCQYHTPVGKVHSEMRMCSSKMSEYS